MIDAGEALLELRAAPDRRAPELAPAWAAIYRTARRMVLHVPAGIREDACQTALLETVRSLDAMRASHPAEAVSWLQRVCYARAIDVHRVERFHYRSRSGQDGRPFDADELAGEQPGMVSGPILREVWRAIRPHLAELCLADRNPGLRAAQAGACFLINVAELSVRETAETLQAPGASADMISQWSLRGRPILLLAIAAWRRETVGELEEMIAERVRELAAERRADVGVPRPERRGSRAPTRPWVMAELAAEMAPAPRRRRASS